MDIGQCADNMCESQHDGHQLLLEQQDADYEDEQGAWQEGGLACEFGGKSGQEGGRFQGTCDYCGKVGHRWRQCWEWQAAQGVLPGYGPLRGKAVGKGQKGKSGAKGVYSDKGGTPKGASKGWNNNGYGNNFGGKNFGGYDVSFGGKGKGYGGKGHANQFCPEEAQFTEGPQPMCRFEQSVEVFTKPKKVFRSGGTRSVSTPTRFQRRNPWSALEDLATVDL